MTDRIEQRQADANSLQATTKMYLDAYNLKDNPGGFPSNTDYRSALQSMTNQESARGDLVSQSSGTSKRNSEDQWSQSNSKSDSQRSLESKPGERTLPAVIARPGTIGAGESKIEALRPEVRLKKGESIQDAIERAPDGATVLVPPGIYRERLNITRDNIILKADGKAILDMDGRRVPGAVINISDRKNVTIDGFEIRNVRGNNTPTAIRVDGASSNIRILNNDIHHVESGSNGHGIGVFGTRAKPLKDISIAGNKLHDLKLGQSEALVVNGNVDGFKIVGNKIWNSDNIGIDIIGGEGVGRAGVDRARNGTIARNHISGIDSLSNPTYKERCAAGIYVDGGKNVLIEDNTILNSNYGIELASERKGWNTEGVTVRGNRLSGNHLAGITLGGGSRSNGGVTDSIIENNDLRGNSVPIWRQNNIGNVQIRNNRTR